MALEKVRGFKEEKSRLLIYDIQDEDKACIILDYLQSNGIFCSTLYNYPGKQIFTVCAELLQLLQKVVYIMSVPSDKNEQLNFILAMVISKVTTENIITVLIEKDKKLDDKLQLLQMSNVIRIDHPSWLEHLKSELLQFLPRYVKFLNKGTIIDNLMFQGLCIQHMRSNILGILVLADKLCLQIDLEEYLKHEDSHEKYNTAEVLKCIPRLCHIDSSVIIILRKNRQDDLKSVKDNIAEFAATVIDTSLSLARCDWSVACTVKGRYLKEQQEFLSNIYPLITYTLMNKFILSLKDPIVPKYSNVDDRVKSFPPNWRDENFQQVKTISDAGFFYAGYSETARCYHCGCVLKNIRSQDRPLFKHAARYPSCMYVKRNLTEEDICKAKIEFAGTEEKTKLKEAIKEKYTDIEMRMRSFDSYETTNGKCDVNIPELVEAGFYYVGLENLIQCFNCSVRIYGIPDSHSAWSIHASLSPTCSFVIREKGDEFVRQLDTAKDQTLNADYTVFTFIRKTCDGTTRRNWPNNMFRPW